MRDLLLYLIGGIFGMTLGSWAGRKLHARVVRRRMERVRHLIMTPRGLRWVRETDPVNWEDWQ